VFFMTLRAGRRLVLVAAISAVSAARAHVPVDSGGAGPVFGWSLEPWVLALLGASMAGYLLGVARLWRHAGAGRGIGGWRLGAWVGGWLALFAALVSPLDPLGEFLFSAHMLQHEVLMVVAAPLLVLARPLAAWTWALPAASRRGIGGALRHPAWRTFWGALTAPASAWGLHAIALWGWHLPWLFESALEHPAVHVAQHFSFLATALLFWWATLGARTRSQQGAALVSLFTTMIHTGALGALMTLSALLWYPHYASTSARYGLDPLEDQQLGGLIMWVPAGASYLVAALAIAVRWLGSVQAEPARA
jgi:putative membrane protein